MLVGDEGREKNDTYHTTACVVSSGESFPAKRSILELRQLLAAEVIYRAPQSGQGGAEPQHFRASSQVVQLHHSVGFSAAYFVNKLTLEG